ncbi:MAG: nucleotidyltransferase domain-containing protein [bacterium]
MVRKKNKLELENLLTELCNRIKDHYELDEILLFGSYAKGTANEWSDVDVAIISPSLNKRSVLGNVLDISNKIKFYDSDLQLTAFPSQNFYQESFDPQSFIGEIKRTSKKIYNKKTGLDFSQL